MGDIDAPVIRVVSRLADYDVAQWNACAHPVDTPYNPFLSHAFLVALEESGSASADTGWLPQHLVVETPAGDSLGAMPLRGSRGSAAGPAPQHRRPRVQAAQHAIHQQHQSFFETGTLKMLPSMGDIAAPYRNVLAPHRHWCRDLPPSGLNGKHGKISREHVFSFFSRLFRFFFSRFLSCVFVLLVVHTPHTHRLLIAHCAHIGGLIDALAKVFSA